VPLAIEELLALTVIACSVAAVIVSAKLLEVIPLWDAVMLLEPAPTPEAIPAVKVAAAVFEEVQVADVVRFCVLPSLNVPVAVNCSTVPLAIEAFGPLIAIDCRVAAVTAKAKMFEVMPLCVAVMLLEPTAAPVSRPPGAMVAAAEEDAQVTEPVKFWVLPSLKVPVAVN